MPYCQLQETSSIDKASIVAEGATHLLATSYKIAGNVMYIANIPEYVMGAWIYY
ncbi:hypothetical protein NIES4101_80640 [Calothrix sp. NIES-4101]|nr:hypothetical protein NIES4101_80640 [Calothrix sp. NIES-4101]